MERLAELKWDFSCPDWKDRLALRRSLIPPLPLDERKASRAVKVFNKLRLPDVPGMPSMHEAAGDWFRDIIRALFGSEDDEGRRWVGEIFGLVPKKNSKTTGGAGIMLTALILNKRPAAEFLLVGPTQEIADLAYSQASGMIKADHEGYLQKRFRIRDHIKTIEDLTNGALLKIKTFDMSVMTGVIPAGVLVDELHVMSAKSYASRVIGQIRGGLDARPEGFLIFITTQSDEPPAGCFKAELQLARGIRDGRVRGAAASMLPVLYEFPEELQRDESRPWTNSKLWPMVLPNLGLSVNLDRLKTTFAQAQEKGDQELCRWASQHLNIEIGMALHAARWVGTDYWLQAEDSSITLESLLEKSEVIVAGIDGGGLDDLLGLVLAGREKETNHWLFWSRAWAQDDVFIRRAEIAERLRDFAADGDLVVCAAPTQDIEDVADILEKVMKAGLLPEEHAVGLDPQGVAAMIDELVRRGIGEKQLVGVPQGYRLTGAIKGMERKLKDGTLRHAAQPLMTWCVSNAKAEQRGNAIVITKETAGKSKIDPLIAAFNAVSLLSRNPAGKPVSPWEDPAYKMSA